MNLGLVVALPAGLAMLHPLLALGRPSGEAQLPPPPLVPPPRKVIEAYFVFSPLAFEEKAL